MAGVVAAKLKLKKQQQEEEDAKVRLTWRRGPHSSPSFLEQIWSQLVRGGEGGLLQEEGEDNFQGPAVYGGASCLLQKCLSPVSSINFLLLVRICFEAARSYQTKP